MGGVRIGAHPLLMRGIVYQELTSGADLSHYKINTA